jgi:hypothetical protein
MQDGPSDDLGGQTVRGPLRPELLAIRGLDFYWPPIMPSPLFVDGKSGSGPDFNRNDEAS